jgi:hypothetical protein
MLLLLEVQGQEDRKAANKAMLFRIQACSGQMITLTLCVKLQIVNIEYGRDGFHLMSLSPYFNILGHAVAQLVEALRYKPEGCGFDS